MTDDNIKVNIQSELARAHQVREAADLLFNNGFYSDGISRLYYFLLHCIRALLLTKGLEPKSHEGVLRVFGLHFIKEGIFDPSSSHIFAKLMKYREEADYNPAYIFVEEDFIEFRKEAEVLTGKIKTHLAEKGYLA